MDSFLYQSGMVGLPRVVGHDLAFGGCVTCFRDRNSSCASDAHGERRAWVEAVWGLCIAGNLGSCG